MRIRLVLKPPLLHSMPPRVLILPRLAILLKCLNRRVNPTARLPKISSINPR